jgi:hypothetical protein
MTRFVLAMFIGSAALGCDRPTSAPPAPAANSATPLPAPPASPTTSMTASSAPAAAASAPPTAANATGEQIVTFDSDPVGAPSPAFEGIVGDWYVAEAGGARGLEVDGSKWRNGTPSVSLADQAKRLYGERYAEFLDGVKAFAFFPFAVWKSDPPRGDIRISMRFFPIAGRIDQGAGIAFAIAPDGTYLGFRANALEDNLLYFCVVKGKRTIIDTIRNVQTPTKAWHTLAVEVRGKQLAGELDGQKRFEKTLDAAPQGKVGLWSKADSQVLFDEFKVTPIKGAGS